MRLSQLCLGLLAVGLLPATQATAQQSVSSRLLSHRAVYTLSLDTQKPSATVAAADGKLDYALVQTSCAWFRATTTVSLSLRGTNGQRVSTTSTTEVDERAGGGEIHFKTRRVTNGAEVQASEGTAERGGGRITVRTRKPQARTLELSDDVLFPVQLLTSVLDNAEAGRPQVAARLYDGAEDGVRPFRVMAQVGAQTSRAVPSGSGSVPAWPVAIGYFNEGAAPSSFPDTELASVLLRNGVYTDVRLTFRDFAVRSTMTEFTPIPPGACD